MEAVGAARRSPDPADPGRDGRMDWRARHAEKLTTAHEAAAEVRSRNRLWIGMFDGTPVSFARALVERRAELRDVSIHHYISLFPWIGPETKQAFRLVTAFATPVDRGLVASGTAEYLPLGNFNSDHIAAHHPHFDVSVVTLSPPDAEGHMSFGGSLWANRTFSRLARRIFAEIDPSQIRTHGENWLHVSEVERMWERDPADRLPSLAPQLDAEAQATANTICKLVAGELIEDGDCLQLGIGDVSSSIARFLGDKQDLGVQTEVIPSGVIEMVERGVITGARKQVAPGKVVGTAFAFVPPDELARAHLHRQVELWDFCRSDDLRILVQNERFKAINNALQVDVTGQVTAETLGPRIYSGPGGQTVFAVAASYSRGGASIIVLPSTSRIDGELRSRIVGALPAGAMVTVPRTFVDCVVTEHGTARLAGKTLRERIDALVAIAHPDFRDELRAEARRVYAH
jgi:acyl-CoA hydrolase